MSSASTAKSRMGIRQQNLTAVIRLVQRTDSISRAELGNSLGLSKTAISELVDELESLQLLRRSGNEQSGGAGRPSQTVSPSSIPQVLVVNPEIDGINLALVDFGHTISSQEYLETKSKYSIDTAIALVQDYWVRHKLQSKQNLLGICLALPGAIDQQTGRLVAAPSLGWVDLDASTRFQTEFKTQVWSTNNARAATISELFFGAAKNATNAACLFSGVGGVGGGLIINGQVLEGSNGLAGEIGKMSLLVGTTGDRRSFGELMDREALVRALGATTLDDQELDQRLAESRSPEVHKLVDLQVGYLTAAVRTLRDLHDPELIVFGGYLGALVRSRRQDMTTDLNLNALKPRTTEFLIPRVAELKPMVLIGAAQKAWDEVVQNPYLVAQKLGLKPKEQK